MQKFRLLATALIFAACSEAPIISPGATSAEITFRTLITDPIPSGVTNISGGALTYQGYRAYLVFSIDETFLSLIKDRGLVDLSDVEVSERFDLDSSVYELFPSLQTVWIPASVKAPMTLGTPPGRLPLKNVWTHSGEESFLIDLDNMIVYYKSHGA